MLRTAELEYELPAGAVATMPAEPRDHARLMVVGSGERPVEHARVRDMGRWLRAGDLLVLNTTRVAPARFVGRRADTGGGVEGLFLREIPDGWSVLLRARRLRAGVCVTLHHEGAEAGAVLRLIGPAPDQKGAWVVAVEGREGEAAGAVLRRVGLTPLPPYILRARAEREERVADDVDRARYQTVFAEGEEASSAAPTAGLHFTPELLAELREQGVRTAEVVLHVGTGTFKPVETEFVEEHPMHEERCFMSKEAAEEIGRARRAGGRVVAVGTTAARVLETYAHGAFGARAGAWACTRILIAPGHEWRWVDALFTNFHLPRSTLMAMVAAKTGVVRLREVYGLALEEGYRFYSYGDAMLVMPEEGAGRA